MLTYAVRTECIECIQALLEAAGLGSFDLFAVLSETQNCDIITLLLEKEPDMVEMLFAPKDRRPGDFNGNSKLATLLRANICKTAYVKLLLTSSSRIDIGMRIEKAGSINVALAFAQTRCVQIQRRQRLQVVLFVSPQHVALQVLFVDHLPAKRAATHS